MKKITLLLILTGMTVSLHAQRVGELWKMRFAFPLKKTEYVNSSVAPKELGNLIIPIDVKLRIVKVEANKLTVHVLASDVPASYKSTKSRFEKIFNSQKKGLSNLDVAEKDSLQKSVEEFNAKFVGRGLDDEISNNDTIFYYEVDRVTLTTVAKRVIATFQPIVTLAAIPFKYRKRANEFTTDVSLIAMTGFRFPICKTRATWGMQLGVGFSSVDLHSENSNIEDPNIPLASTLTVPIGLVFQWDILEVGGFLGWDFLRPRNKVGWKDNAVMWFGFGIGISLYNQNLGANNAGPNAAID